MFDLFTNKVEMTAIALISLTLLISVVTISPTLTRVLGFGTMDENATTEKSTSSQTETSIPPPDVTETKDEEGNTILSLIIKNVGVTAMTATQSIKEDIGIPEVARQVLDADKKDYDRGLLEGVNGALQFGENADKFKGLTPEQVNKLVSGTVTLVTKGESDAYKIGVYRGFGMGSDLVDIFGVAGTHKQPSR